MSWKMFWQIVLLIVIAVIIMAVAKAMKYKACGPRKMGPPPAVSEQTKNFGPSRMPMKKGR